MRQGISGDIPFRVSFGACAEAVREFAVFEHSASFGFGFPRGVGLHLRFEPE